MDFGNNALEQRVEWRKIYEWCIAWTTGNYDDSLGATSSA
jgi:hypothetical protein